MAQTVRRNGSEDDWEMTYVRRTLVLVGRTGNGKSATGNSIIGQKAFKSRRSSSGVTESCESKEVVIEEEIVTVIDTPGLFDLTAKPEFIGHEIMRCIRLAEGGIHAVLVVLSVKNRFSEEEESAIQGLQMLFGENIIDYMIVVFTGGDELEESEETLDDYFGNQCPDSLKSLLLACDNRVVLFDNKTKDEQKKALQVHNLLSLVNEVVEHNGGQPFTDKIYSDLKKEALLRNAIREVDAIKGYSKQQISLLNQQMQKGYQEHLKRVMDMVESRLREATKKLEMELEHERAARARADNEINKLHTKLIDAKTETDELRRRTESNMCVIL